MKNSEDPVEILHKRHFIRIDTVFYFDSEYPDEMPHKRHFIRVCSVFYDIIDLQRKRYIINCNPSRNSMGHPDFTVWNIELFSTALLINA